MSKIKGNKSGSAKEKKPEKKSGHGPGGNSEISKSKHTLKTHSQSLPY